MALTASSLTAGGSTTDANSFGTASVSPAGNSLLVLWVVQALTGGATVTGVTGLSLTWTQRKTLSISSSTRVDCWTAPCGASPGSGAVTISLSGTVGSINWDIDQYADPAGQPTVVTGNIPTGGPVTSTAASVTYAAAGSSANLFGYGCGAGGFVTQTPSESPAWTELADQSQSTPSCSLETQVSPDVTHLTGSSTLSVSVAWGTIGIEIAAAPATAAAAPLPRPVIRRRAPVRARLGRLGLCAAGIASQIVTPLGAQQPHKPPVPVSRPVPHRAVQRGFASAAVTPRGSPPSPLPRPVIQHLPPERARTGPRGLCAAGNAGPQPAGAAPVTTAYQRPQPQISRRLPQRALWRGNPAAAFPVLVNTFEGGTSGVAVSPGNSGGASGNAFDAVTIGSGATLASDNARAVHGGLSCQVATVASAVSAATWSASMGPQATAWFRAYLYFTANPGTNHRVVTFLRSGTLCGYVQLLTTGKLQFVSNSGGAIFTTTAAVPLGAWFRIEGFLTGDPAAGQVELKLFTTQADGVTADETDTSSAAQNTAGHPDTVRYGVGAAVANTGPFWMDDLGLSATGYLGPSGTPAPGSPGPLFRPQPRRPAPARGQWRGLASRIVTPLGTPARRPGPQITSRPRTRAIWRGIAGTIAAPVTALPKWRPLPARRKPQRARTGGVLGLVNAVPPAVRNATSSPAVTAGVVSLATAAGVPHGASVAAQTTSAASATDPRDGTASVTAPATSSPAVSDG